MSTRYEDEDALVRLARLVRVEEETPLVRLASVVRVEEHKRRTKTGKSETVHSYMRKVLDAFGGPNVKTKRGAFADISRESISAGPRVLDEKTKKFRAENSEEKVRADAHFEAEKRVQDEKDAIGNSAEFRKRAANLHTEPERQALWDKMHGEAIAAGRAKTKEQHEAEILKRKGLKPRGKTSEKLHQLNRDLSLR